MIKKSIFLRNLKNLLQKFDCKRIGRIPLGIQYRGQCGGEPKFNVSMGNPMGPGIPSLRLPVDVSAENCSFNFIFSLF